MYSSPHCPKNICYAFVKRNFVSARAAVCFGQIYSIASACISSPVTLKDSPLLCAEEPVELALFLQETINSLDFEHLRAIVLVPF